MKEEKKHHDSIYVDQRTFFVNNLYKSLRMEDKKAKCEYEKKASVALDYLNCGLSEEEAVELMIVDGLDRDAAKSYVVMAKDMSGESECVQKIKDQDEEGNLGKEYSFVFKDSYGNTFSSYDIDETITASSKKEAMKIAWSMTGDDNPYEIEEIITVEKIG